MRSICDDCIHCKYYATENPYMGRIECELDEEPEDCEEFTDSSNYDPEPDYQNYGDRELEDA